jgi:hypothetical protein
MAHKFARKIHLDANGAPLARGPVEPEEEAMYRIWVWVTQEQSGAAARGSADWSNSPKSPKWNCTTTLFDGSPPFQDGDALGMAVALVKKGNGQEYFGWWDGKVEIV